jgi:hypothetical protein
MPEKIVDIINKITEARGEEFAAGAMAVIELITPASKDEQEKKEAS